MQLVKYQGLVCDYRHTHTCTDNTQRAINLRFPSDAYLQAESS